MGCLGLSDYSDHGESILKDGDTLLNLWTLYRIDKLEGEQRSVGGQKEKFHIKNRAGNKQGLLIAPTLVPNAYSIYANGTSSSSSEVF